jgi:alpha-tubulin suppressor-like RCC1 family protein
VEGGALAAAPRLTDVSCGIFHALAVDEEGRLYAWGDGSSGQLGSGGTHDELEPVLVAADLAGRTVVAVSAASEHSACVTADGTVFTWGIPPPPACAAQAR